MKKLSKFFIFIIVSILSVCISACGEGDEIGDRLNPIRFDTIGILLTPTKNKFELTASIESGMTTFILIPNENQQINAYITSIEIDGETFFRNGYIMGEHPQFIGKPRPVISGDWGNINYWYDDNPYAICFQINENTSNKIRKFIFTIGNATEKCDIFISQEAKK